jgi:hypothetical protein
VQSKAKFERLSRLPERVELTAPALPEPTASTKQENNDDDNQNQFQTHFEALLGPT